MKHFIIINIIFLMISSILTNAEDINKTSINEKIEVRMPQLSDVKLNKLMEYMGVPVPDGLFGCLCGPGRVAGGGCKYAPGHDCWCGGPLGGGGYTGFAKNSHDRCMKSKTYDDGTTIVDKISVKIENDANKEKRLDDDCIKINEIPSSGVMKGAVTQGLFDLPDAEDMPVREGTYDIIDNKLPDYWNAWWDRFSKRTGQLWQQGYPKPVKTNLTNYNSLTLEYLEQNVCQISDPCKQAIFIKLFLDANQDDFVPVDFFNTPKEKFAEVGLDIMLTIYVPNEFDITKFGKDKLSDLSKWGQDKLIDPSSKGFSSLKVMSKLKNTVNIMQAISKIATGTHEGQVGRWKFAIYEQALKKGWTPERIEGERRVRLAQNNSLLKEIKVLNSEMEGKVLLREEQHKKRLAEIEKMLILHMQEIQADEDVAGETQRRLQQLNDSNFVVPGTENYRPGVVIADRVALEEMRQRYLADAKNYYDRMRSGRQKTSDAMKSYEFIDRERDIRMIAKTHNEKMSENLGKMAKISAENDVLKHYATPVSAGECEKLRTISEDGHK